MKKQDYQKQILDFINQKGSTEGIKPKQLARQMGVSHGDYGDFRSAYKKLRAEGRLIMGSKKAITFPNGETTMLGRFRSNPKGFGFVIPEDKSIHCDLFIPAGRTGGALEGDMVLAKVVKQDEKEGQMRYAGMILEITQRGSTNVIGTLEMLDNGWVVVPDGRRSSSIVIIRDVAKEHRKEGLKVKADIIWYPPEKGFPEGIIVEVFGNSGHPAAEISAILASYNFPNEFSEKALEEAHAISEHFNSQDNTKREDLTKLTVVTIDPDTARDYDDAISLEKKKNENYELGIHIADVAEFIKEGSALDEEAKSRAFSIYFPRFVIPMLPGVLSNGICSLQEGVLRYTLSVFIEYDKEGKVVNRRATKALINSAKRFTYVEAQNIIDGEKTDLPKNVVDLLMSMNDLAKRIEARRKAEGMIHLDLHEIELVLDDEGRVTDAKPSDNAYTHKIIEMFMVEANEATADILAGTKQPYIRRIHPTPDSDSLEQLVHFCKSCGHLISENPKREDLISLVEKVRDTKESYAVNLAVLRSFQRATYSIEEEGHFALASKNYSHFTSPIRRYPDLIIHRALSNHIKGQTEPTSDEDRKALEEASSFFSVRERQIQAAELELRMVLILTLLTKQKGTLFQGVVTGITEFGLFIQHPKFLIEGLIRYSDLGDDWWEVSTEEGKVRGEYSGKVFKIGTVLEVRIDNVNIALRQLELSPSYAPIKKTLSSAKDQFVGKEKNENSPASAKQEKKSFKPSRSHISINRTKDRHKKTGTRTRGGKK